MVISFRGSEWGHLDNTTHLMFWLCNMKQFNFKLFNTNRKKFTVTVNFGQKETKKRLQKGQYYFFGIPRSFQPFSDDSRSLFRRFPKNTEDFRRFPRRNPNIFDYISSLQCNVTIYNAPTKNDSLCHSFLVKSSWICAIPDRPDVPAIKGENELDGTARSADRHVRWGIIVHTRSLSRCRIHPLAWVDQSATATTATTLSSTNVIPVTP